MSAVSGFSLLPQVIQMLKDTPDRVVTEAATQIAAVAKELCPVDTGAMQSTIYVESHTISTYGQGFEEPDGDSYIMEEIEQPPSGTAYTAVAVNYAMYVEMGTRFMGAEPFLIPALETIRTAFEDGTILTGVLNQQLGEL
jgi:HK97 gp10 family phage protein